MMNRVVNAFTNKLSVFNTVIVILVQFLGTLTKTERVKVARVEARGTCPLDMSSDHLH